MNIEFKDTVMIRKGNDNQEPALVYVSHWSENYSWWVTPVLNEGDILFSNECDLIPFNYRTYKKMYYEWKIANQKNVTYRLIELLNEWK